MSLAFRLWGVHMEINSENIERGLWVVLIVVAIWIIHRIRRRSKEADSSYRSVSRGFAQRLAKKRLPHEVSLEDMEEDEEPKKHMTAEDWARGEAANNFVLRRFGANRHLKRRQLCARRPLAVCNGRIRFYE